MIANPKERHRMTEYLKNKYREACKDVEDGLFTTSMISILTEMARHDIWPDGTFSDADCNAWGIIHIAVDCGIKEG